MPTNTHQEIVWFDISVYDIFVLHILNSANRLDLEKHCVIRY